MLRHLISIVLLAVILTPVSFASENTVTHVPRDGRLHIENESNGKRAYFFEPVIISTEGEDWFVYKVNWDARNFLSKVNLIEVETPKVWDPEHESVFHNTRIALQNNKNILSSDYELRDELIRMPQFYRYSTKLWYTINPETMDNAQISTGFMTLKWGTKRKMSNVAVSNAETIHLHSPKLKIEQKVKNLTTEEEGEDAIYTVGDKIQFDYIITNEGSGPAYDVKIFPVIQGGFVPDGDIKPIGGPGTGIKGTVDIEGYSPSGGTTLFDSPLIVSISGKIIDEEFIASEVSFRNFIEGTDYDNTENSLAGESNKAVPIDVIAAPGLGLLKVKSNIFEASWKIYDDHGNEIARGPDPDQGALEYDIYALTPGVYAIKFDEVEGYTTPADIFSKVLFESATKVSSGYDNGDSEVIDEERDKDSDDNEVIAEDTSLSEKNNNEEIQINTENIERENRKQEVARNLLSNRNNNIRNKILAAKSNKTQTQVSSDNRPKNLVVLRKNIQTTPVSYIKMPVTGANNLPRTGFDENVYIIVLVLIISGLVYNLKSKI